MRTSRRVRRLLESVSPYAEVEDLCEIDGKLPSDQLRDGELTHHV